MVDVLRPSANSAASLIDPDGLEKNGARLRQQRCCSPPREQSQPRSIVLRYLGYLCGEETSIGFIPSVAHASRALRYNSSATWTSAIASRSSPAANVSVPPSPSIWPGAECT